MAQSPALKKLCAEFVGWLVNYRGYSLRTQATYDLTLEQFRSYLRHKDGAPDDAHLTLARFTEEAVQGFVMDLAGRRIHPNTIINKLAALSSFAQHLMQRRDARNKPLLTANPTKTFAWPTLEEPETRFLHPAELAAFLAVEVHPYEAVARAVLFDTGIRVSEACRADVGDLVPMGAGWSLAVTVKGRGTRRRKIHMPLSPAVAELVRGSLADRGMPTADQAADAAQPLLVTRQGRRFTQPSVYALTNRIAEAAGITRFKVGPHTLRHTINVVRSHGDVNEYQRSALLGQADQRSQRRYQHIVPGELADAKLRQAAGLAAYLARTSRGDL